jgi:hypothetical protein
MPGFPLARGSDWAGGRDHTPSRVPQRWGVPPAVERQLHLPYHGWAQGVIIGWDRVCERPVEWVREMKVDKLPSGSDQVRCPSFNGCSLSPVSSP